MATRDRWDDEDDRSPRRPRTDAIRRTRVPGLLILLCGLLGAALEFASLGVALTNPTAFSDAMMDFAQSQPPGKARDDLEQQIRDQEAGMRLDAPVNLGSVAVGFVANLLMVIGGWKMRAGTSYGWSMAGAITTLYPFGGCCCFAAPFGLWALVVLLNPDVKAAFAAARRSADGFDDGLTD